MNILTDVPPSLETDRLRLRIAQTGDGVMINEAVTESLSELAAWMPWACREQTVNDSETFARTTAVNFLRRTDFGFLIFSKSESLFLGIVGVHERDQALARFEIGYWLRTSATGKGHMTEAVNGLTTYAIRYLSAARIEIRADTENAASAGVARRAGYTLEGTLRRTLQNCDGELRDAFMFSKIRGVDF